jgi:hypothetical protein
LLIKWWLCKCTAKSQWTPSSREINFVRKGQSGIKPRFNQ